MKSKLKFALRQWMKMLLQNVILPCVYAFWRLLYCRKEPDLIIFADAHHEKMPESMVVLRNALERKGYQITAQICNFAKISAVRSALFSIGFMRLYARAKYVFICDNFLPVSSCRKCEKTKVIQLWHSCGLLKKIGYATSEDIPKNYRGNVYRNYDLVTVSAPCCIPAFEEGMRQKQGIVQALGISRTDVYFDEAWQQTCREEFYRLYPAARGKKVILWTPTFRGNPANPYQVGTEVIEQLAEELGEEYYVIIKVHPHIDDRIKLSNCDIQTEKLFPVADLMITDYSSTVCEFMMFHKPYVLFAPDLEEYEAKRGFFLPYREMFKYVVTDATELKHIVLKMLQSTDSEWIEEQRLYHVGACDGHSTKRILDYLGL